jgi:hypothetical protein
MISRASKRTTPARPPCGRGRACETPARGMRARRLLAGMVSCGLLMLLGGAQADAAVIWRLGSNSAPTYLQQGGEGLIVASAANLGDTQLTPSATHPLTITDRLPAGLQVPAGAPIQGLISVPGALAEQALEECTVEEPERREVVCKTASAAQPLAPYRELKAVIPVTMAADAASGEQNTVSVNGGEGEGAPVAAPAPAEQALTVKDEPTPFGIESYELSPENEEGSPDVQAGSHPFQLTTMLDLNETLAREHENEQQGYQPAPAAPALARNLSLELPPGLLGDPQAVAQCPDIDFSTIGDNDVNACPATSAIGVALVTLNLPLDVNGVFTETVPVFNLVPAPGEPARFGLEDDQIPVILDTSVRTDGDYGVNVTVKNITQAAQLLGSTVTLWGEPANPAHDGSRGWACIRDTTVNGETCTPPAQHASTPFLALPTSCLGGLATRAQAQAWSGAQSEANYIFQNGLAEPLSALDDCDEVPFNPTIGVQPLEEREGQAPGASVQSTNTPAGLAVNLTMPGEEHNVSESAVRSTTVALPAGVQLSPSAANGLEACSEGEIGYEGPGSTQDPFLPGSAGVSEPLRFSTAPVTCPEASKVGLVDIKSPDLSHELEGAVYIAEQTNNPFGSLFALYLVAEDPVLGIRVKLAGQVSLNEQTGQITSTFGETPQVPFEGLRLRFFEGARASLSTPALCGSYATLASLTPWAGPTPLQREAAFQITSGGEGEHCADPLPFAPGLKAGSSNPQAGAFSSFSLTLADPDADQRLTGLSVQLPPGIAAMLASVTPCPEPQAAREQCGPESLIGRSLASAGFGPEPYELPGNVYLTGPYQGAPFGIEVVTPAIAGPFNLGTVTVRSRIDVDPRTAAVTITSDPIPQLVKGVPAQIKQLKVTVDRPGFQFNPTSCNPGPITATLNGNQGATSTTSYPFETSNCTSLLFDPGVSAQTLGKTSKAEGASLDLEFTSHPGEAHVAKTILTIPATLPARLTTIQKACIAATFEANPAACPEGSDIGTAVVRTPVLKSPVAGPIYLVSHGNAAWPDAELVLQGEGITVILDGQTAIKKGVTTSSFLSVPDVPFETVQATLPEGPHSALTMNPTLAEKDHYDLCGQHLTIPAQLTGQNGTLVNQNVKVAVQGCAAVKASKTKKLSRTQQLARALETCRRIHARSRAERASCERQARRRFSARQAARKRSHSSTRTSAR